jgi:hypothetical protein
MAARNRRPRLQRPGVLRRRPIRDGERWLVLKEAAVYGDDPRHAFALTPRV